MTTHNDLAFSHWRYVWACLNRVLGLGYSFAVPQSGDRTATFLFCKWPLDTLIFIDETRCALDQLGGLLGVHVND